MHQILAKAAILFSLTSVLACSASESDSNGDNHGGDSHSHEFPEADCDDGQPIPRYSQIAFSKCTGCHSSELPEGDRNDAPLDINYNTHAEAIKNNAPALGAAAVHRGDMPNIPPDMTDAEKTAFYRWVSCGTPQ
jgi:uncharacterized membrane protein